jgi:hypothetical protein
MYEVIALIPESSDFSLDAAVTYFCKLRKGQLPAELVTAKGKRKPTGFRVSFGGWCVFAWLESGEEVLAESQEFAKTRKGRPAKAAEIATCSRRLSVCSDEDAEAEHTDEWIDYVDFLRERFGVYVFDNVNGEWTL